MYILLAFLLSMGLLYGILQKSLAELKEEQTAMLEFQWPGYLKDVCL